MEQIKKDKEKNIIKISKSKNNIKNIENLIPMIHNFNKLIKMHENAINIINDCLKNNKI